MAPAWAEEDVINRFDHLMFRAVAALGCGATDSVQATRFDSWAGTDVHMISSAGFTALFIVVSRHHADALGTRRGATALSSRQRVYYTGRCRALTDHLPIVHRTAIDQSPTMSAVPAESDYEGPPYILYGHPYWLVSPMWR